MTTIDTKNSTTFTERRSPIRYAATAAILLACAAVGAGLWWRQRAAADARAQFETATVKRDRIETLIAAMGTIEPRNYVDVGTQVSGQIKRIDVEVGSVVHSGQPLAEIDPTVYRAAVDARRASLRNQFATHAEYVAQFDLARLQLARQRSLAQALATSSEALETAEANVRIARARVDSMRATIEQTQSALQADEASLGFTRIYAPMSGVVVSVPTRQGQTLNASQQTPVLLRIADLSTMTVEAQVSEGDVGKLYKGMDVYFSTLGGSERWTGKLAKVEPTPTVVNNVVLYKARFDVSNVDNRLLPQMTAQVFFVRNRAEDALVVPASAVALSADTSGATSPARHAPDLGWTALVTRSGDAASDARVPPALAARTGTARVLRPDGAIETRIVSVGIDNRANAQILRGLRAGERVIVGTAGETR
ncbi:efflux RND transporter periplasmic adaptor subunit [Paraburkholderia caledonica]|uniref:Macrolide-specific efflux system membrane fusion protein n=1 Tax=Paraburkholderia caledonica TaxID=134536 RepID=A0AB73II39_9BURK|nr:macrolide-specific efflux system membrane fusion protein [Paraburkholderia caledonica]